MYKLNQKQTSHLVYMLGKKYGKRLLASLHFRKSHLNFYREKYPSSHQVFNQVQYIEDTILSIIKSII
jgi:hypothetical protein